MVLSFAACRGTNQKPGDGQETAGQMDGLTHMVFLALTKDAPKDAVITDLLSLSEIPEVMSVKVIDRLEVGDARALEYDLLLIAEFTSLEDLKIYDQDQFHQQIRAKLKPHLRLPPATFDYQLPE